MEYVSMVPRIGARRATYQSPTIATIQDQLDAELGLAHAWDLPVVTLDLGVSIGAGMLHQSFETRGIAPDRASLMAQLGAGVGLSIDLNPRLLLVGGSDGANSVLPSAGRVGSVMRRDSRELRASTARRGWGDLLRLVPVCA
jgi:hypothetical protein